MKRILVMANSLCTFYATLANDFSEMVCISRSRSANIYLQR